MSLLAPIKFVPLSVCKFFTPGNSASSFTRARITESESMDLSGIKATARVEKQVIIKHHRFWCILPTLVVYGPKTSRPLDLNGAAMFALSGGRLPIF